MITAKSCSYCGEPFEAKSSAAKYCSAKCRNRQHTHPQLAPIIAIAKAKRQPANAEPASTADEDSGVVGATRRELIEADRLATSAGQAALRLAAALDSPHESGAAKAALAKQLQATMAKAMEGVRKAEDPVDELRARRSRRAGA